MRRSDFSFSLPSELIAQYPLASRTKSRLLHYDKISKAIMDKSFNAIEQILKPGDLLVLNNTKVIPARLFGHKATGGKIEILLERIIDTKKMLCHIRASKAPLCGSTLFIDDEKLRVCSRKEALFLCALMGDKSIWTLLEEKGHVPLPPYIERADNEEDLSRYQTVFAKEKGAVAAPTAGLHFDEALLQRLEKKGVNQVALTLHVGAGTFQPVKTEVLSQHKMHKEWVCVSQQVVNAVNDTKKAGGRVVAVGTTVVRSLESAFVNGTLNPFKGDTDIFITPGFTFRVVDGLITNFHLPESTLVMLVAAFIGYEKTMQMYQHAIKEKYRFFSYGDTSILM